MYFVNRKTFETIYVDNYGKDKVRFTESDGKQREIPRRIFDKWFMRK